MNVHKKHITDIGDEISVINWHPYLAIAICMIRSHGNLSLIAHTLNRQQIAQQSRRPSRFKESRYLPHMIDIGKKKA